MNPISFLDRGQLESVSRRAANWEMFDDGEARATILGGLKLHVDPRDPSLAPWLLREGYWESWVTLAVSHRIRGGMRFVDVGANVGYYSILAAAQGAEVLAIEPNPQLASMIGCSAADNDLFIHIACCAASNVASAILLRVHGNDLGGASLCFGDNDKEVTREHKVWRDTLDMIVKRTWLDMRVDFVKIDAEGSEYDIWRGMRGILTQNMKVVVLAEMASDRQYDVSEWLNDAIQLGFRLQLVNTEGKLVATTIRELLRIPKGSLAEVWFER